MKGHERTITIKVEHSDSGLLFQCFETGDCYTFKALSGLHSEFKAALTQRNKLPNYHYCKSSILQWIRNGQQAESQQNYDFG